MSKQISNENFPVIRCIGIGKSYSGTAEAVKDVDLTVYYGEILVLLGPSGCGKTTLLRLVAGLEEPTNGTLALGGQLVSTTGKFIKPENRKVGMVFQDYALFPHLNVQKNIEFGLDSSTKSSKTVEEIINLVGLFIVNYFFNGSGPLQFFDDKIKKKKKIIIIIIINNK